MSKFRMRTLARHRAFKALYSVEFNSVINIDDLRKAFDGVPVEDEDNSLNDDSIPEEIQIFGWMICAGVWANVKELDEKIARQSGKWHPNRMGRVEITVLRMALYEMLMSKDGVPAKVVISEAMEILARYADAKARYLVNGILDALANENKLLEN